MIKAIKLSLNGNAEPIEIEKDEGGESHLQSINSHIGCNCFDVLSIGNGSPLQGHELIVDDDGLLDTERPMNMMVLLSTGMLIAGHALLVHHNKDGELVDYEGPVPPSVRPEPGFQVMDLDDYLNLRKATPVPTPSPDDPDPEPTHTHKEATTDE